MSLKAQSLYHQGSEAQDSVPLRFTVGASLVYDDNVTPALATVSGVTLALTIRRTVTGVSRLERGEQVNVGRISKTVFNNKSFILAMIQAGYLPAGPIDGWRLVLVNLAPETEGGQRVFYMMKKSLCVVVPPEILRMNSELLGSAETYRERVTMDEGKMLAGETTEFHRAWRIEGKDPVTSAEFGCVGVLSGRDVSGPLRANRAFEIYKYRWSGAKLSGLVGSLDMPGESSSADALLEGSVSFSAERPFSRL